MLIASSAQNILGRPGGRIRANQQARESFRFDAISTARFVPTPPSRTSLSEGVEQLPGASNFSIGDIMEPQCDLKISQSENSEGEFSSSIESSQRGSRMAVRSTTVHGAHTGHFGRDFSSRSQYDWTAVYKEVMEVSFHSS